jgi:hypothetical protein
LRFTRSDQLDDKSEVPFGVPLIDQRMFFVSYQLALQFDPSITYIRTRVGWLYLAVVLDLFSRKIVCWATQSKGYDWHDFLKAHGLISSMSLRGNCHDNAVGGELLPTPQARAHQAPNLHDSRASKLCRSQLHRDVLQHQTTARTQQRAVSGRVRKAVIKMRLRGCLQKPGRFRWRWSAESASKGLKSKTWICFLDKAMEALNVV